MRIDEAWQFTINFKLRWHHHSTETAWHRKGEMQQKLKSSSRRVVGYSHLRSRMVASLTLKGQLIFWAFLILLFMLGFVIFINHVAKLIQSNCFSLLVWKGFLSNGLSILVQQAGLFVNGLSEYELSISILTTKNPAETGSTASFNVTPTLSYLPLVVWTQNEPKHLTVPLLTAILTSLPTLLNHLVFHWRIYITWMRRDVREVVEREVAAGNIFTREGSVQNTSTAVPTSNLSQLLKQSVQMEQHSSPDLCFQARHSVLNGLKSILILCMNLCCVSWILILTYAQFEC